MSRSTISTILALLSDASRSIVAVRLAITTTGQLHMTVNQVEIVLRPGVTYNLLEFAPREDWLVSRSLRDAARSGSIVAVTTDLSEVAEAQPIIADGDIPAPTGASLGDMLVFDGNGWIALAPGEDGYVLGSNGDGALPSFRAVEGVVVEGGVASTRNLVAGAGLTGGGDLSTDRTFNVVANADGSIVANANDVQVGVLATDAQHGVRGGGSVHSVAVSGGAAGFMSGTDKAKLDSDVPSTRSVLAGTGLTGGGALSDDVTVNVAAHADGSIVVAANDVRVGILATDAQHGTRGGGSIHAVAISGGAAGFMSGTDKAKLDSDVVSTRSVLAGAGLTGGGDLSADRTFNVVANADGSIVANANDIQVGILASDAQHGVRGGGTQHANAVSGGAAGFMSGTDKAKLDSDVPSTRSVIAGAGLTGGGALSGDVTVNVIANADGSVVVNANDVQVGILASDAQHGTRGGGTIHAVAVAGGAAGFLSGADKSKLDGATASLTYAASVALDFDPALAQSKTLALTGNVTFTTSNRGAGRSLTVLINSDASIRTFTFPAGWKWLGSAPPPSLAAGKYAVLSISSWGSADTDTIAAYAAEL